MALSHQDLIVYLLLGKQGYYVDIGAGNGEGEPCASNTAWLEELGWTGLLLDINQDYIEQAKRFRLNSTSICEDAFAVDYKSLFNRLNVPTVIDYLTIDVDPLGYIQAPCVEVLSKFPFDKYDFKFLTIEHDLYNPHGPFQKEILQNYMKNQPYKLFAEDVGLAFNGKKYLEDWYINPKYYQDFKIKDIENLYYLKQNPNQIVIDLSTKVK
jgi:hypothetical protein